MQSWDTANKATELADYSVCTTWRIVGRNAYLLHVLRRRMEYPDLKRAVREQQTLHRARLVLIEDKSSGTSLIQDLVREGMHGVQSYRPTLDKVMRLHAQTPLIENGFVYLPQAAPWLESYLLEITTFPNAKYDDQTDSTSQFLDWFKRGAHQPMALFGTYGR